LAVFEGNSQVLDHILVSDNLLHQCCWRTVHIIAEFGDQVMINDPSSGFNLGALNGVVWGNHRPDTLNGSLRATFIMVVAALTPLTAHGERPDFCRYW